jgi:hypothetical protein
MRSLSRYHLVLATTSFAGLLFEVLLTRYCSVILWNQLVFVAVSVALFGLSCGAVWAHFSERKGKSLAFLSWISFAFSCSVLFSTAVYFLTPVSVYSLRHSGLVFSVCFLLFSWPFVFAGAILSAILNAKRERIGSYYAFDLLGASLACLLFVLLLDLTSAENLVFLIACIGFGNAFLLASGRARSKARLLFLVLCTLSLGAFLSNHALNYFKIHYAKGRKEKASESVRWNSFSRISVVQGPSALDPQYDKIGTGPSFAAGVPEQVFLEIDAFVGMPVTRFDDHDARRLGFLKKNVTSLAYVVKKSPSVFVVGPGGGRDVLAALAFDAAKIKAVELNPIIVNLVRNRFREFSGGLYSGGVKAETVVDEARSYLARHPDRYDVISVLLVDTWASSMNGSLSMAENHLYTLEAFSMYLDKLSPDGILSVTRWIQDPPRQMLRVILLGHHALKQKDPAADPARHFFVAGVAAADHPEQVLGTCLMKKTPFTPEETAALEAYAKENGFRVYASPSGVRDGGFFAWEGRDLKTFVSDYPYDISPTTDNRPFFFMTLKIGDFLKYLRAPHKTDDIKWLLNIALFLIASTGLLAALIALFVLRHRAVRAGFYFSAIGAGFILIENVLIQIFNVFLGYPSYSLLIVLFGLLFSAAVGSWTAEWNPVLRRRGVFRSIVFALCIALVLLACAHQGLLAALYFLPLAAKILATLLVVGLVGFALGQCFPFGTRALCNGNAELFPWVWALNGVASVAGATLAISLSMTLGFSICMVAGALFYLLVLILS